MAVMENSDMLLTLGVGIAACALAVLSIVRTRAIIAEQRRAIRGQDLEIAFKKRVLDEHSLTTITDTNGIVLDVNQKFLDTFGYKRSEIIGRPFLNIYHDDDVATSEEIRSSTPSGKIWSGETRLLRADGSIAVTQTTVVPLIDETGRHVKNLSLRSDVTEFRASEYEKSVTSAFDKMLDAVILHDPQTGRIIYMNHFALAEHGWTSDEATGHGLADTLYLRSAEKSAALYDKVQETGKCTMLVEGPEKERTYEARSYAIRVEGGEQRVLTFFRDVTKNVATERERNHLVSVITHELRTPLTSIKGSLGLLDAATFGPMSTGAKDLVSIALRNSDRMLELIRGILDAERSEEAGEKAKLAPVNLSEAVDAALATNLGYGAQLGINFINSGSDANIWIEGNEGYVSQILSNLMSNAAKFSPDGASVEVWVSTDGPMAVLNVRDQGAGIDEALQPRLFERFTQSAQSDRGSVHSSGLGLSIVKSLVDKLGGTIDFETTPGQGTCFHVRLPLLATKRRPDAAYRAIA